MTQTLPELHEILYCSQLAAGQSPRVVGSIVSQARTRNAEHGITGLLVFDGQRFCQHLEGPRSLVVGLMSRISEDPRHEQIRVVYDGPLVQRRYQRFDMGFAQTEEPDDMAGIHTLDGPLALARFLELRPRFDI
ncbi:MAG: BLUF domain-containing protein [Variovorax sp.]|jgi:hypothetical protein|nr:MAG: BLUF domain-containing protein [Variovorax sp.]